MDIASVDSASVPSPAATGSSKTSQSIGQPPVTGAPAGGPSAMMESVSTYLSRLSGQIKEPDSFRVDHNYSKPWNRHPDPMIKTRPAKFLFMKHFPKHFMQKEDDDDDVDVVGCDVDEYQCGGTNPLIVEVKQFNQDNKFGKTSASSAYDGLINSHHELPVINKTSWSSTMQKLYAKTLRILQADRMSRLAYEGRPNELILRRNLLERTSSKLRHLFASAAAWEPNLMTWLHNTLNSHLMYAFLVAYNESMQFLRQKIPFFIDRFYSPPKQETTSRSKQIQTDSIQNVLNNHRPKRIGGSPLFLLIPSGPQVSHQLTSQRMKMWHNLFGALGKVINVTVNSRPAFKTVDFISDIRMEVRDKIKECKTTFNEGRPLVLVGFGFSSLIAAHCSLDNATFITATVCIGFPLTGINGFRGDLDDPLLETTVPTLFIIGQNSVMSTLDDIEDFRERILKTETGLVVVGGANDNLVVSNAKKKADCLTQAMVDRCIATEIFDFVSHVINPNYSSSETQVNYNRSSVAKSPNKGTVSSSGVARPSPSSSKKRKRPTKEKDTTKDKKPEDTSEPIVPDTPEPSSKIKTENLTPAEIKSEKGLETDLPGQQPSQVTGEPSSIQQLSSPSTAGSERHYGESYGVSKLSTVIGSGTTRTRQIRAPKQLDM